MTQVSIDNVDAGDSPRFETPTFDPRSAFATTLRSGEIALRERRQRLNRPSEPDTTQQVDVRAKNASPARHYAGSHVRPSLHVRPDGALGGDRTPRAPAAADRSGAAGRPRLRRVKHVSRARRSGAAADSPRCLAFRRRLHPRQRVAAGLEGAAVPDVVDRLREVGDRAFRRAEGEPTAPRSYQGDGGRGVNSHRGAPFGSRRVRSPAPHRTGQPAVFFHAAVDDGGARGLTGRRRRPTSSSRASRVSQVPPSRSSSLI